ncbi:MAG TPA: hypothetical protein VHK69_16040, partial [Chitinophagaceae bacterium]|jgi:hypothetical protein|nr:hypothetical protein [Chitinophagaceae bacterium]
LEAVKALYSLRLCVQQKPQTKNISSNAGCLPNLLFSLALRESKIPKSNPKLPVANTVLKLAFSVAGRPELP